MSILLFIVPFLGISQSQQQLLPLDSILQFADRNAAVLKIGSKRIQQSEILQSRSSQIPNTSVGIEYGNINSAFNDTRFYLNQGFAFPKVYKRQKEVLQKNVGLEKAKTNLDKADLHLLVRQLSYQIMDLERKAQILDEIEVNFGEWRRIALLQQQEGEINKSILNAIELKFNQNKLEKLQLLADRELLLQDLKQNINSDDLLVPILEKNARLDIPLFVPNLLQHPTLKVSDAIVAERKAQQLFNQSKLLPELTAGYSNLSIVGWQTRDGVTQKYYGAGSRFGVIQFGMGIPLFNGSAKARIKASTLDTDIAEIEKGQQVEYLNIQYAKLVSRFIQYSQTTQYYEREGLKLADEMRDQATIRLKAGEISFAEWTLLVSQSLQIKISYATAIHELQMVASDYYYLTEKN